MADLTTVFGGTFHAGHHHRKDYSASPTTIESVRHALTFMPAHELDSQDWLAVCMAIHSEYPNETGFELCDSWSAQDADRYDAANLRARWRSFKAGKGTTIATLFNLAKQRGYKPQAAYTAPRISPEVLAQQAMARAAQQAQADADKLAKAQAAAIEAQRVWDAAKPCPADHPYLVAKGVQAHGTRIDASGALIVPMTDLTTGALCCYQEISPDGKTKKFHGPSAGTGFLFGEVTEGGTLVICEGFSTSASAFEATGHAVLMAGSSGALKEAAMTMRAKHPETAIIIGADDDADKKINAGMVAAHEAAQTVNGLVAVPDFGTDRPDGATDFNDLCQLKGADAVVACFDNATNPANPANPANFSSFSNENGVLGDLLTPANAANFSPWIDLDPLPDDELPQSGAFPFHAMGKVLGDAAQAIAQSDQLPDAMAGGSVLGAASLVCQPFADVLLPHGSTAPLSLYIITAGTSGDRKSRSDKVACHVIEERRNQQSRENHRAETQYKSDMAARAKGDPAPIEPPKPQALTIGNATVEGIGRLLAGQSSVGVFSPDGGDMLGGHSMRGEQRASGVAFFLKAWGGESLDTARGGAGLKSILGRRVALHIMIQPVLLGQLLSDPLAAGQGLLARCLITAPDTLAGTRLHNGIDSNEQPAVQTYHAAIQRLLDTPPELWPDSDGFELKPRKLRLTEDATRLWIAFHDAVEIQQGRGKELEAARPWASKAAEHAARLAGVLTIMENPHATQINDVAMGNGIELAGFYLTEHLRLTGTGRAERATNHLRVLWDWLQSLGTPFVEKKTVTQKCPYKVRSLKAAGINPLLTELERRGYIQSVGKQWRIRTDV